MNLEYPSIALFQKCLRIFCGELCIEEYTDPRRQKNP